MNSAPLPIFRAQSASQAFSNSSSCIFLSPHKMEPFQEQVAQLFLCLALIIYYSRQAPCENDNILNLFLIPKRLQCLPTASTRLQLMSGIGRLITKSLKATSIRKYSRSYICVAVNDDTIQYTTSSSSCSFASCDGKLPFRLLPEVDALSLLCRQKYCGAQSCS